MADIIVSAAAHAVTEQSCWEDPKHQWIVEGDFGFLGSFAKRSDAYAHANEIAASNEDTVINVLTNE